ncbi:MAG: SPOR domain-containing protein [Carboxylicivirga sp.]|jgi:hypothetical protein|nr:SPOR domain-containing protein [Carboxylicivirga sp.]
MNIKGIGFLLCFMMTCHIFYGMVSLNSDEQKSIIRADRLIDKGNQLLNKSESLKEELRSTHQPASRKQQICMDYKLQAANYFRDGYRLKINALAKNGNQVIKDKGAFNETILEKVKTLSREAAVCYRKADNQSNIDNAVKLVEKARQLQLRAIDLLEQELARKEDTKPEELAGDVIVELPDKTIEETEPDLEVPNTTELTIEIPMTVINPAKKMELKEMVLLNDSSPVEHIDKQVEAVTDESKPVVPEAKPEPEKEEPLLVNTVSQNEDESIFLTIQIIANKSAVSPERLKTLYNGSMKIFETQEDGWFRYSIGHFRSLDAARKVLKQEAVDGWIVGYKNNKRIYAIQAIKLLKDQDY